MDGIIFSVRELVSVTRVFRSSWVSYESHLRVSSGWVCSIFKWVLFRVIGFGISYIFGSGGDQGSGGVVNCICLISLGRQDTVIFFSTSFLVEAQVRHSRYHLHRDLPACSSSSVGYRVLVSSGQVAGGRDRFFYWSGGTTKTRTTAFF